MRIHREPINSVQIVEFVNKGFLKQWGPKARPHGSPSLRVSDIHSGAGPLPYNEGSGATSPVEMLGRLKERQNLPSPAGTVQFPTNRVCSKHPRQDKEHTALGFDNAAVLV